MPSTLEQELEAEGISGEVKKIVLESSGIPKRARNVAICGALVGAILAYAVAMFPNPFGDGAQDPIASFLRVRASQADSASLYVTVGLAAVATSVALIAYTVRSIDDVADASTVARVLIIDSLVLTVGIGVSATGAALILIAPLSLATPTLAVAWLTGAFLATLAGARTEEKVVDHTLRRIRRARLHGALASEMLKPLAQLATLYGLVSITWIVLLTSSATSGWLLSTLNETTAPSPNHLSWLLVLSTAIVATAWLGGAKRRTDSLLDNRSNAFLLITVICALGFLIAGLLALGLRWPSLVTLPIHVLATLTLSLLVEHRHGARFHWGHAALRRTLDVLQRQLRRDVADSELTTALTRSGAQDQHADSSPPNEVQRTFSPPPADHIETKVVAAGLILVRFRGSRRGRRTG